MARAQNSDLVWHKALQSGLSNCVQVAQLTDGGSRYVTPRTPPDRTCATPPRNGKRSAMA
jgi:hypothetical protein